MDYAQIDSTYYCGIDLHARSMYVCIMDRSGNILFHREMRNEFSLLLAALEPYRPQVAIGVESTFNWYWLADGCRSAGIPFYLGHALYMKAVHGGKKKNDRIDSKVITDLLRGNLFPLAYPYPQQMRATRDLLRRRHRYVALRAEAYTHIQNTFSQHAVLDLAATEVKKKSTRRTIPQRLPHPDLSLTVDCDLEVIDTLDALISQLEKHIWQQAKDHDRNALEILTSTPGVGEILALTILYEIHTIRRFPSPQCLASYARLVKVERTSDGKPVAQGHGNNKIGNPHLKWAFGEILLHAQRPSEPIRKTYERLQTKHGPGKAKSILAHKFAIAIYYLLKNGQVFEEHRFVN
jgi:transposase